VNAKTLFKPNKHFSKLSRQLRIAIWPAILVFLAVLAVRAFGWTESLSLKLYNLYNQSIAQDGPNEDMVIVAFTDQDFKLTPNYPYNDEFLSKILRRVVDAKPRTILLNLVREQAVEPGHAELLDLYKSTPNLLGIVGWDKGPQTKQMAPPILRDRGGYGFTVAPEDVDLFARLHVLGYKDSTQELQSTAMLVTQHYLRSSTGATIPQLSTDGTLTIGAKRYPALQPFAWEYRQLWPADVHMHLLPQRHRQIARVVTFGEILSASFDRSILHDRLVIVGTTASSVVKYKRTPLLQTNTDGLPAIEFTAMQIDNLLGAARGDIPVLSAIAKPLELLCFALMAWISCWLFMRFKTLRAWVCSGIFSASLVLLAGWLMYRSGWLLPVVPMCVIVLFAAAVIIQRVLRAAGLQRELVDVMRVLMDKFPDPIFVLDDDRRIRLVNAPFCRLAMARPEELIGQSWRAVFPEIDPAPEHESLRSGILRAKDGSERTVQASVMRHASGNEQKLRIGVITAASAAHVPAHIDVRQQLAKRVEVKSYLAGVLSQQASFVLVVIADFDVFFAAHSRELEQQISEAVCARLSQTFGESGVVSSLGSGRFAVLTVDLASKQLELDLQAKVVSAFSWPVQASGQNHELELQFAYCHIANPPQSTDQLIAQAELALQDLMLDYRIAHQMPILQSPSQ
jgi:PAS domain S-box-containing protein